MYFVSTQDNFCVERASLETTVDDMPVKKKEKEKRGRTTTSVCVCVVEERSLNGLGAKQLDKYRVYYYL
jgi:hypothetical protein